MVRVLRLTVVAQSRDDAAEVQILELIFRIWDSLPHPVDGADVLKLQAPCWYTA